MDAKEAAEKPTDAPGDEEPSAPADESETQDNTAES
jgi:hypothetical protein